MSLDLSKEEGQPVTRVEDLVAFFRTAERPRDAWMVGLEHEKLLYPASGPGTVPYEGDKGVGALLAKLQPHGYRAFKESEDRPTIALLGANHTISLEPGGQLELSGTPSPTARAIHQENLRHAQQLREAASQLGILPVALGYRPFESVAQMPWMPKTRYQAMRDTLGPRGALAKNMMLMTATGQVSLDWSDEADCVRKVVVVARLTPLLVALYANSPLVDGRPTGYRSFRSRVWTDVDVARCGFLPAIFENAFSYRAYVEWALDVPLLFLRRKDAYLTPKLTFRTLLEEGFEGEPALLSDWTDHLSTLFPEVRLKRVLEVRGADCVGLPLTGALAALWRGILYDDGALAEAARLLPPLSYAEHLELMEVARREGLSGTYRDLSLAELSLQLVQVARAGLGRLDPEDAPLLDPLEAQARSGRSPADLVLSAHANLPPPELLKKFAL